MANRTSTFRSLAWFGLVLAAGVARADTTPFVAQALPQEGRLLDANDQPVNGAVDMTFRLYHQANGGTAAWSEAQSVQVDNGYYAIRLGDPSVSGVEPITADVLAPPTYLAISIGGAELSPRLELGTVPYAERADLANRIDGGTITNATITNSTVDATQVTVGGKTVIDSSGNVDANRISVNGQTVIDASGNLTNLAQQLAGSGMVASDSNELGGKPASDYVTNDELTQGYATSSDLADQEYDNRARNGSFELGAAGQLPTYWSAVGIGNGSRSQVADPMFGAKALEVNDSDSTAQVAVEQTVIAAGDIAGAVGETFTASVFAKRKSGSTRGRLCLAEGDPTDPAVALDCATLTAGSTYARQTVSHLVTSAATELVVLLDSGATAADANDYVFDGVMVTRGKLAPAFTPNIAEEVSSELPDQSIPDAALPADVALLDAATDAFTGDLSAHSFTGSGAGLSGIPDSALSANVPLLNAPSNAFTGALSVNDDLTVNGSATIASTGGLHVPALKGTQSGNLNLDLMPGGPNGSIRFIPYTYGGVVGSIDNSGDMTLAGTLSAKGLTETGTATLAGSTTLSSGASGQVQVGSDLGALDFGHFWTPAPTVNGETFTTRESIRIDGTGGDLAIGYNQTSDSAAIIADGPIVSTEQGASFARGVTVGSGGINVTGDSTINGTLTQGCSTGWTAVNGGRLCVENAMHGPTDFYSALGDCQSRPGGAFHGHICTYMQAETACASGFNFYAGSSQQASNAWGWYGDDSLQDDWFPTWNSGGCGTNNTGTGQSSGTSLYYRCCY